MSHSRQATLLIPQKNICQTQVETGGAWVHAKIPQPDGSFPAGGIPQTLSDGALCPTGQDCRASGTCPLPQPEESFPARDLQAPTSHCNGEALPQVSPSRPPEHCRQADLTLIPQEDESFPPTCVIRPSRPERCGRLSLAAKSACSARGRLRPVGPTGTDASPGPFPHSAAMALPASSGLGTPQREQDELSWDSSTSDRIRLAPDLATLQPEVPFEFVTFDLLRGPVVHYLPHGSGPEHAVLHAVRHAPFPEPVWTRPRAYVPGFPHFQVLLMRSHAQVTVILDQRPLEGEVLVMEVGSEPLTGVQFACQVPIAERSPIVAQVIRASQLVLYHNYRPWALAYFIQLGTTSRSDTPLLIARVGVAGHGSGVGTAPGPHLLLALARALRGLLQELPRLNNHLLVASPLQDAGCGTYREIRFVATDQVASDAPTVWLDRRLLGGGLHHLQVPSCLHVDDLSLFDSSLIIDLAALRDVAAIHTGSTLQQAPLGYQGSGLVPVADLFHLEGMYVELRAASPACSDLRPRL